MSKNTKDVVSGKYRKDVVKEYWITPPNSHYHKEVFDSKPDPCDDLIHVVDYSEYSRIKVRLEATDKYLSDAMDTIQIWRDRCTELEGKG